MAGKIAVVTGGGGGIGASTGELFCSAGASVVLADWNADALEATVVGIRSRVPGARIETACCDVGDPAEAERVAAFAHDAFGGLNVLVSNAAIRHQGSVEDGTSADWERLFRTNVIGAVNFTKASLAALRRSGNASIVVVSSCYAVIGRKGMPIYDASKAALLSLVKTLAWEEAGNNVRVNAVCPGGTITPYTLALGREQGKSEDEMREERKKNSLLGRRAEAHEIAYPIMWLASDEASYITGATLMVDGGLSVM
jgi:2-hydroxycyclohexanecarboxyl-CoA dehydrogenase